MIRSRPATPPLPAMERQLSLSFDTRELRGMTVPSRRIASVRLTRLLLEAAGCTDLGRADDER